MSMTKIQIAIAKKTGKLDELYAQRVSDLIRERYSISAELSIHRQRDTKAEEFAEYNAFAEACKIKAKKELGILEESNNIQNTAIAEIAVREIDYPS